MNYYARSSMTLISTSRDMSIFDHINWGPMWKEKERRPLTQKELDAIQSAKIVETKYGDAMCFLLKNGEESWVPIADASKIQEKIVEGRIDLKAIYIATLEREGDEPIHRIV